MVKCNKQIAIGTDDVYKSGEVIKIVNQELGGKITREAGPLPGLGTKIVSFLDPDGWKTVSNRYKSNDLVSVSRVGICLKGLFIIMTGFGGQQRFSEGTGMRRAMKDGRGHNTIIIKM